MEVKSENFTIAVDSKRFVADPNAQMTLDGAMAFLSYVLRTGEHRKANYMLCQMLTMMIHEYGQAHKPKGNGWHNEDSSW